MMIMGEMLKRNARLFPSKIAFIQDDRQISFKDFATNVNKLTKSVSSLGIKPSDRVAVLATNCIEYFELYGLSDLGAVILVPLNYRLQAEELTYLLNDSGASMLFFVSQYRDIVDQIKGDIPSLKYEVCIDVKLPKYLYYKDLLDGSSQIGNDDLTKTEGLSESFREYQVTENDPAYILYTSGTTGLPRGVVLTHRGQYQTANALALDMSIKKEDITLDMMPLYHTGGHAVAQAHFYRGCTSVITTGFNPRQALQLVETYKVTTMQVVPAMLMDMLNQPDLDVYDQSSLRMIFYASSPMPEALLRRAMDRWGQKFFQAYGLTENGPVATILSQVDHYLDGDERHKQKLKSCGLPSANCDTRVWKAKKIEVMPGEIGEIVIKGDQLMKEYWGLPELTANTIIDGWLYTGDLATVDEEGYIYIVDRKKDMIISGGENIYPREIEEIIYRHSAVLECAVLGIPDPKWVEAVHAVIVLKQGTNLTAEDLIIYCRNNLTGYKAPKSVELVDSLPKNPSGKILKKDLKAIYWSETQTVS